MGETYDEGELEDELAELEQEALDTKMLDSGNVPVSDQVHRLPAAVNPESKFHSPFSPLNSLLTRNNSQIEGANTICGDG